MTYRTKAEQSEPDVKVGKRPSWWARLSWCAQCRIQAVVAGFVAMYLGMAGAWLGGIESLGELFAAGTLWAACVVAAVWAFWRYVTTVDA